MSNLHAALREVLWGPCQAWKLKLPLYEQASPRLRWHLMWGCLALTDDLHQGILEAGDHMAYRPLWQLLLRPLLELMRPGQQLSLDM